MAPNATRKENLVFTWIGVGIMLLAIALLPFAWQRRSAGLVCLIMALFAIGMLATTNTRAPAGRRQARWFLLQVAGMLVFMLSAWLEGPERFNAWSAGKVVVMVLGAAIMFVAARAMRPKRVPAK